MTSYIKRLQNEFKDTPDLVIKKINKLNFFYVIFLETLTDQNKVNEYILKFSNRNIKNIGSNQKVLKSYDECEYYLYNGYTLIIKNNKIYAIETKAELSRSLSTNETEPSLKGPKNAFIENYQTNVGLLKRRIKSSHLKVKNLNIGRLSNTKIGLFYIDNITKDTLVNSIYEKLSNIDIDIINGSENLLSYLTDKTLFPTAIVTERPDRCAKALSEGKIVIICDESPSAIILPAFLVDFLNPFSDYYNSNKNINFTKIIRMLCFFLSVLIPGFYVSIINYNQEAIPTSLIINFASQRDGVPFPAIVECILMLVICEILRESDLRFPTKYGSAISILGALVLGEAAVSAGLVSPIMIIITAFTYISSFIFTEIEFSNSIRFYRFIILILACLYGIYGLLMGFVLMVINLCSTSSINENYTFPISPYDKSYFDDEVIKRKNKTRSKVLSNNIIKEK